MSTPVNVPPVGESVSQVVLLRWIKNDGDVVAKDEPIAELETDKANVEMPSPAAGSLRTSGKIGESYKVGDMIGTLEDSNGSAKASTPAAVPAKAVVVTPAPPAALAPAATPTASAKNDDLRPSVRRLVEENKLDAGSIPGTGPGGKVTKEDVTRHMDAKPEAPAAPAPSSAPLTTAAQITPPPSAATPAPGSRPLAPADESAIGFDANGLKRVPMTKIRKRIAQTLVQAQQTAAILTTFNEVDMSQIMALR